MDHSNVSASATPGPPIRWENRERRRYYQAWLQQNLFGEWEVARAWGGIGSRRGGTQFDPVDNSQVGQEALCRLASKRTLRGYTILQG